MKNQVQYFIFLIILCISNSILAQDITGKWVANKEDNDGHYEVLFILEKRGKITGFTYDEYRNQYCKFMIEGTFNPKSGKVKFEETEWVDGNSSCLNAKFKLKFRSYIDVDVLKGTYSDGNRAPVGTSVFVGTMGAGASIDLGSIKTGTPILYKKESDSLEDLPDNVKKFLDIEESEPPLVENEPIEEVKEIIEEVEEIKEVIEEEPIQETEVVVEEVEKVNTDSLMKVEAIDKRELRTTSVIDQLAIDQEEVTLHIYDSKTEDNDRITIFLNDEIIAQNLEVKKKYQEFVVKLSSDLDVNRLTFYANNLGDVPPNTANLRIIIGTQRKHYVMSTNELENTAIEFTKKNKK